MLKGLFVTGTDTGVGKTFVTAALARHLSQCGYSIGVMKPVETGVAGNDSSDSDAAVLKAASSATESLDLISPYRFSPPLAPLAAARQMGVTIELERIVQAFEGLRGRHTLILVEGVGGVMVPVGVDWDVRDLIRRLGLPVLVVGRATLGGVNHALLTLEALKQRGLRVFALLLNQTAHSIAVGTETEQMASTVTLLRERSGVPVLGPLTYDESCTGAPMERGHHLSTSPCLAELAAMVTTGEP
jgi:dethiobiotin synthetase